MRLAIILALLAQTVMAAPPSTCRVDGAYEAALCSYQHRRFAEAETAFRVIVEKGDQNPETLRAMYFLARTLMKTGRFAEAGTILVGIYSTDRTFYDGWSCDYLLGECRRAAGRE
ncbi:MAG: tetratricopeptide repeat protein [Thermoanaerobaculia bacterium]